MRLRDGIRSGAVVGLLALAPLPARAQDTDEDRRSVRVGAGIVSQGGVFGDDSPRSSSRELGATVSVGVRRHPTRLVGLAFDTAFDLVPIKNPHFDESVRHLFLQVGLEIGRRVFVRPTGGVAVNLWSGTMSSRGLSLAPAFALAAGYQHTTSGGIRIQPQLVARITGEVGAVTWSTGAQIAVSLPNW